MSYHPLSASAKIAGRTEQCVKIVPNEIARPVKLPVVPQHSQIPRHVEVPTPPISPPENISQVSHIPQYTPNHPPRLSSADVSQVPDVPVLGAKATDTHFFDGKMSDIIHHIRCEINRVRNIPNPVRIDAFNALLTKMRGLQDIPLTPGAVHCFCAISSMNGNYDPVNNLDAGDLLYLLYEKIVLENSHEHASLLAAQLDDMTSGLCPQGRTTRLLQILIMLKDDLTPSSKPRIVVRDDTIELLNGNTLSDSESNEVVIE